MTVSVQTAFSKKRINWNQGPILKLAIEGLKNHGLKKTANQLKISQSAIRFALKRRGIETRILRKSKPQSVRIADQICIVPRIKTDDPFLAQSAFEARPDNGCSWPIGELADGDFHFCGKPKLSGKSYCKACYSRAYIAGSEISEAGVTRIWLSVQAQLKRRNRL